MKIQLHDIPDEGLDLELDASDESLASLLLEVNEGKPVPDFRCHFHLARTESVVTVEGDLSGHLSLGCSRCLEPVPVPLAEQFRFFLRGPLRAEEIGGDEIELGEDALEYGFLEGETIDAAALVHEQLLLTVPAQPLCRPDCKGICQRCGAELNHEPCRCVGEPVDPRFSVLKNIKLS